MSEASHKSHLQINVNPVVNCFTAPYSITYPRRVLVPNNLLSLQGKINSDAYTPHLFSGLTFAPGQLLCTSAQAIATFSANGQTRFKIVRHCLCHPESWLKEWNPASGQYETVYLDKNGNNPLVKYASTPFTGVI